MLIDDLACTATVRGRRLAATVTWEERDFPNQRLFFEITDTGCVDVNAGVDWLTGSDDPSSEALLTACFPLAAIYGERRVRIDANPCPMLIEGLRTAHAWWESWGGMPGPAPQIETCGRRRRTPAIAPRRAIGFLSGGVDGLHMLMRNRQLYQSEDPAFIRDVVFVHGFDIGKRRRDPEEKRYQAALQRLVPVAAETGVRLLSCRTNLRHLPSRPSFWEDRHAGAGLAAVGHAAARGSAFVFIGGSYSLHTPIPWGSHLSVDGLFSSQSVGIVHDGSRFTRLDKVRDLASWPTALAALRCCPASSGTDGNCGRCEKCLRTRLELLAVGIDKTAALGPSFTPLELWDDISATDVGERIIFYDELLPQLRRCGYDVLCGVIEKKIELHQGRQRREMVFA